MIGIDLGTTHSLVAVWNDQRACAEVIPNALSNSITPSVVSVLNNGEFVIGGTARNRLLSHPAMTAAAFKRKMATASNYFLNGQKFSAVDLSALVLKQLKQDAENFLGEAVTEAIISVPAYFHDAQRKATILAAQMAGLKVNKLINEPTAAALAYGLHERIHESSFLVVDLGGGTLDTSLLEIYDGVVEVHASAGDNYLGGEDFTQAIINDFCQRHDISFATLTEAAQSNLYNQANTLKERLTTKHEASFEISLDDSEYSYALTRVEFENLVEPLLKRIMAPIERVIRDSQLSLEEIDDVVMVGGATRMPCIRQLVSKMLRRLPRTHIDPDQVVALGAAVQAGLHSKASSLQDVVLTDICPYSLGVEVAEQTASNNIRDGQFLPIIERNSTIPLSRVKTLHTLHENQTMVRCNVYQGESRLVRNNIRLGSLEIAVPKAKAGEAYVDVRFTYTNDGILEVIVNSPELQQEKRVVINNGTSTLSDDEIERSLSRLEKLKIHPTEDYPNTYLLSQLERLYEQSLGNERLYIARLAQEFESVLDTQDLALIAKARDELTLEVKQLIERGVVL